MKAMVSAMAAHVSGSEVGRLWRSVGELLESAIPITLTAVVVFGLGWVLLNPTH